MVLNLSDQDSSHHAPNEGSSDQASIPSPESRPRRLSPPAGRATLAHLARAAESLNGNGDKDDDSPIDFSVRRQESADSYQSIDSNLDSVGESIPPSPKDMRDIERRRSSSTSEPPLSPGSGHGYRIEEKIGEPKLGLPGMHPGMAFPPLPGQLPPGFPLHMMANLNMLNNLPPRNMEHKNGPPNGGPNDKNGARPFKAYPKDPLSLPLGYFGLPGVPPLPGIDVASLQALNQGNNSEEMFKHYREYVLKRLDRERDEKRRSPTKHNDVKTEPISPIGSPTQMSPRSPLSPPIGHTHAPPLSPRHPPFPHNFPSSPMLSQPSVITANPHNTDINISTNSIPSSPDASKANDNTPIAMSRKRGRSSDGMIIKDEAYWERRRKNNEAAKRSRDSRRAKEDEIAIRAAFLEQENLKLRVEVTALKNETAKLRCMLYNS